MIQRSFKTDQHDWFSRGTLRPAIYIVAQVVFRDAHAILARWTEDCECGMLEMEEVLGVGGNQKQMKDPRSSKGWER